MVVVCNGEGRAAMLQRMDAEILYLNPDHVSFGVAVLIEHDFAVEVLDWVDDCGAASRASRKILCLCSSGQPQQ